MAGAAKKISFSEYQDTLSIVLGHIDKEIQNIKDRQKNLPVWRGYENYKAFLNEVEKKAIKKTASELDITAKVVRDRWNVMTLPSPVYCAIEDGKISFSKAKYLTAINFDFNNEGDAKVAEEIIEEIKYGLSVVQIKEIIEKRSTDVWNEGTVVMASIVAQLGVKSDSRY